MENHSVDGKPPWHTIHAEWGKTNPGVDRSLPALRQRFRLLKQHKSAPLEISPIPTKDEGPCEGVSETDPVVTLERWDASGQRITVTRTEFITLFRKKRAALL